MAILVISTRQGATHEAEVRDTREADHEVERFRRAYLANHPHDAIADISVVSHGNIIARYKNGGVEEFYDE